MTIAQIEKRDYLFSANRAIIETEREEMLGTSRQLFTIEEFLEPWRL